jgi:5-methylcytosine-specific restriction enzyme subunit McrC
MFDKQIILQPTGQSGQYILKPRGYAGMIRLESCVLVIRPKVPVANLFWMLSHAHELADFQGLDAELVQAEDIFEFIVRIFAQKVFALAREGLTRGYVEQEENLTTVRGRIDMMQHLRKNCAIKSRISCRYVEHTEDIPENRILKLCCFLLLREPLQDQRTIMTLRSALGRFDNVKLASVSDSDIDSLFFSRLTERYAGCIALARILLARMSLEAGMGPVPVGSFLIDMDKLFERFVASILRGIVGRTNGQLEVQRGVHITVKGEFLKPIWGIPDLLIRQEGELPVVLDTKYKDPGNEGWKIEDIYQMATHCQAAGSQHGILIYASPTEWQWSRRLINSQVTVSAISLPLASTRESVLERIEMIAKIAIEPMRAERFAVP